MPRRYRSLPFLPVLAALILAQLLFDAAAGDSLPKKFVFERAEMGLPFRITLYASSEGEAREAADAAFERISTLNNIFSDYDSDTELSRLSRTSGQGKPVPVSSLLWEVIEKAQALSIASDGAFDITVGPLVNTWRRARRKKELPSVELLGEMTARVGYRKMRLFPETRSVELLAPEMRLDLGAIAKGFAIDQAMAVLKKRGFKQALVGGSGDLLAGDPPPGQTGWRIEIAPLDVPGAPPAQILLLANRALATSGDVFQRVEIDGKRYSHIVDPRTGFGLTDHSLVTVVAPDCVTADSLATAVSVLGAKDGLTLVETKPGVEAKITRKPGEKIEHLESSGWKNLPFQ